MLPYIAMLTMLIDHTGVMFYPDVNAFRIIGRIAFPLYCWFLVQGYFRTRDFGKYARRLLVIALVSQVPFSLAFQEWSLNVVFTLFLGLLCLRVLDRKDFSESDKWWCMIGLMLLSVVIPMDYGIYGLLLILLYRYMKGWKLMGLHLMLEGLFFLLAGRDYGIQFFSLVGTLLILYQHLFKPIPLNRWIYRSFYPAHLLLLFILRSLIP